MRKLLTALILAMGIGWTQLAGASSVATIGFSVDGGATITNSISGYSVTNGSSYSFDIYVSMLQPNIVAAYDLDVSYSFDTLRPNPASPYPALYTTSYPVTYSNQLGNATTVSGAWVVNNNTQAMTTYQYATPETGGWFDTATHTSTIGIFDVAAYSYLGDSALLTLQRTGGATSSAPVNIKLASLNFTAANTGIANLSYDWSNARGIRDLKGLNNQEIIPTAVPEPSSYILSVIAGLIVAGVVRLRRRAEKVF